MALTRQAAELERLRVACQVASLETIPKAQEVSKYQHFQSQADF